MEPFANANLQSELANMVRIVAGTAGSEQNFWQKTLLGRSLQRIKRPGIVWSVAFDNPPGLPRVFNEAIQTAGDNDWLVFTHDDVWFDDWYLPERLAEAFTVFDVVGVAGNRNRAPGQGAWHLAKTGHVDFGNLSGSVGGVPETITGFGPCPSSAMLLDGVFIAAKVADLRKKNVRFDEQFKQHFYDLDFCREAIRVGINLGVWPIAITHGSGGNYGKDWQAARELYHQKWMAQSDEP